ncbi:hypothetical protein Shyd_48230 [Streptomyces hydrogenans]|uniref:Uncharacterized protein n=1 Tax=Streptomyces hydrogenans TaxID=1873719 RepID=A0ABQ3PEJ5_9ACTN|nr:hypothetical protein Shyd_48230 [Streptomyces hydrogenans]
MPASVHQEHPGAAGQRLDQLRRAGRLVPLEVRDDPARRVHAQRPGPARASRRVSSAATMSAPSSSDTSRGGASAMSPDGGPCEYQRSSHPPILPAPHHPRGTPPRPRTGDAHRRSPYDWRGDPYRTRGPGGPAPHGADRGRAVVVGSCGCGASATVRPPPARSPSARGTGSTRRTTRPSPRVTSLLGLGPAAADRLWRLATWGGPLLVAAVAGVLRFWNLGKPHAVIFDETYYAKDSWALINQGYEGAWAKDIDKTILTNPDSVLIPTHPGYVVHPAHGQVGHRPRREDLRLRAVSAGGSWSRCSGRSPS